RGAEVVAAVGRAEEVPRSLVLAEYAIRIDGIDLRPAAVAAEDLAPGLRGRVPAVRAVVLRAAEEDERVRRMAREAGVELDRAESGVQRRPAASEVRRACHSAVVA